MRTFCELPICKSDFKNLGVERFDKFAVDGTQNKLIEIILQGSHAFKPHPIYKDSFTRNRIKQSAS